MSADAAISRRAALLGAATVGFGGFAAGRGRTPPAGRMSFRVPWPLGSIDPHRIEDATAALFGDALFDTLYARDDQGNFTPSLAESEPTFESGLVHVPIRDGLRAASGKGIDGSDVVFSLERARKLGARAWFAELPATRLVRGGIAFSAKDATSIPKVVRALASPLAAIVPRGFDADSPDGTGPFRWRRRGDGWVLARNPLAARGPAYLDEIQVFEAADLSASLRAFETGKDDLGWLGMGLHEPRPGARPFDLGAVAWAVLRTGKDAGTWDVAGTAQRLCDGLPHSRLSYLGLGPAWPSEREEGWGGPPTALVVREDAPWLAELARAVAATLSRPGHEISVRTTSESEIRSLRSSRAFALMVDVARPLFPGPLGALAALATADDPSAAAQSILRPPRFTSDVSPRVLTRTLRLGVLGEVRVQGGRAPDLVLPGFTVGPGADFPATQRARK